MGGSRITGEVMVMLLVRVLTERKCVLSYLQEHANRTRDSDGIESGGSSANTKEGVDTFRPSSFLSVLTRGRTGGKYAI